MGVRDNVRAKGGRRKYVRKTWQGYFGHIIRRKKRLHASMRGGDRGISATPRYPKAILSLWQGSAVSVNIATEREGTLVVVDGSEREGERSCRGEKLLIWAKGTF